MNERLKEVERLSEQIQTLLTEEYRDLVTACFREHPEFVDYHDICGSKAFHLADREPVFLTDRHGSKAITILWDFLNTYDSFCPELGTEKMIP